VQLIKKIDKWLDGENYQNKRYFILYTVVFLMTALGVFYWFISADRSLVWQPDGQQQHLNALMYYGTYLRNIGRSLMQGRIEIPLWDFRFGFGADVLTTLHYYVIGDPLALLSVFVPTRHMEQLYNFLIIFRLYLAGMAYSLYALKLKKAPIPVLIGALIYAFCGFALNAIRHPFFLNPLIYFPLICLGVEKIFRKEKPYLFIIMVCVSLASSFYFFYMISILIFVYTFLRSFFVYDAFTLKQFVKDLFQFIFYYLIGILMAGVIAFPNIYALFTSRRMALSHDIPLFYPVTNYWNFPFSFISNITAGPWTHMGYATIGLIAVLYLFLCGWKKKVNLQLCIGFIILTTILMIPYLGHVMHGFSYVTNRWIWGYSFLVSFIVTSMLPEMIQISKKKKAVILSFLIIYMLVFLRNLLSVLGGDFIFILGVLLFANLAILFFTSLSRTKVQLKYVSLLVVVIVNLTILGYFRNADSAGDYVSDFQSSGRSVLHLQQSGTRSVRDLARDDEFFRVEENPFSSNFVRNSVVQVGVYGNSFYWSLANPYVSQFIDEIHHWAHRDFQYNGLDGRAMLGALASNRYFVVREGHEDFIPYGYFEEPVGTTVCVNNRRYYAFLNMHALPLGYTYNRYIARNQYDQLSFIRRQQALMQAVLLEEREVVSEEIPLIFNDQLLTYEVELSSGITFENQRIEVTQRNATLTLIFEEVINSEIYVNFTQIYYEGTANRAIILANTDRFEKRFGVGTTAYNFYGGRHDFALNMGYHEEGLDQIEITFRERGTYTFDSIEIIAQPMDLFPEMVANLNEYVLENVSMSTNQIDGTIQLSEERILVLSIPYSEGWRAYVNEERVDVMRANTMFMAIELSAGDHNIMLRYRTPFLVESFILSFTGWTFFCGIVVYFRNKKKAELIENVIS